MGDGQAWEVGNQQREGKNVDEEPAMTVDEEIVYNHVVLVSRQPSVYQQGVIDMAHSEGRGSEHARVVTLWEAEFEAD